MNKKNHNFVSVTTFLRWVSRGLNVYDGCFNLLLKTDRSLLENWKKVLQRRSFKISEVHEFSSFRFSKSNRKSRFRKTGATWFNFWIPGKWLSSTPASAELATPSRISWTGEVCPRQVGGLGFGRAKLDLFRSKLDTTALIWTRMFLLISLNRSMTADKGGQKAP